MGTTITINIRANLTDLTLSREAASPIRREIEANWITAKRILLDFSDIQFVSVSFLDEIIGKLFLHYSMEEVMEKIAPINLEREDLILLGNIVNSRIRQRKQAVQPA